jgi:two-component system response regulator HydG
MRLHSLKSKLLVIVSALVIGSGLLISLLVTHRYSISLFASMAAQAENIAHAVALDATDKILTNDLVALQKMLDQHMTSNSHTAYIFIIRDNQVLAHTFTQGIPVELLGANDVILANYGHQQEIVSTEGERYLDIAWPIYLRKAISGPGCPVVAADDRAYTCHSFDSHGRKPAVYKTDNRPAGRTGQSSRKNR